MTKAANRPPEGLEKLEPVVMPDAITERTGGRRIQIITGGRILVIRSDDIIHTHWEDEE